MTGTDAPGTRTVALDWRPSPYARAVGAVTLAGVLVALVLGRPEALLVAVPGLVALALAAGTPTARKMTAHVTYGTRRCFEGEDVDVTLMVHVDVPVGRLAVRLEPADGVIATGPLAPAPVRGEPGEGTAAPAPGPAQGEPGGRAAPATASGERVAWTLRFARWGRRSPGRVVVELRTGARTRAARVALDLGTVAVYPAAGRLREVLPQHELLARAGEHLAAAGGAGVEFLGVRPYQPGDPPRAINRPVTARTGRPHINERAAQRAADLVIMIDTMADAGPPGDTCLDVAVRAAASLTRGYLRHADRVGVVALGGIPRWLGPGIGRSHLYRIAELLIDARGFPSVVTPNLDRVPRTALPPGAQVVVFSPLTDDRAIATITDLRARGHPTIVCDTLAVRPRPGRGELDALALRLWDLDRRALRLRMAEHGILITDVHHPEDLDAALAPHRGRPDRTRPYRAMGTRT